MSLRKYPPGITRGVHAREMTRARRRAEAASADRAVPAGVVAAAIAERSTGKPLVVETLEAKLSKAIPGAVVERLPYNIPAERWRVRQDRQTVALAYSPREAVDKAIALRGGR